MDLAGIANDIKSHVEQGQAWLVKVVDEHVPALLAEAGRLQSNPIVQALEGLVLPPEVEQEVVNVIKAFAAVLAKAEPAPPAAEPAPAAPEVPEVPADPAAPEAPAAA